MITNHQSQTHGQRFIVMFQHSLQKTFVDRQQQCAKGAVDMRSFHNSTAVGDGVGGCLAMVVVRGAVRGVVRGVVSGLV